MGWVETNVAGGVKGGPVCKQRGNVQKKLRGATGRAKDIFTGALAPGGPRVEPPLQETTFT